MSVLLHEQETFQKVYNELKKSQWSNEMSHSEICRVFDCNIFKNIGEYEGRLKTFIEECYFLNQLAYKRQYSENHEEAKAMTVEKIEFENYSLKCGSRLQLLKYLESIKYNCYDNNGKVSYFPETLKRLDKLIEVLKDCIISDLPEYDQAKWC